MSLIQRLQTQLRQGETTSVALVEQYLERIRRREPHLKAYLTVTADLALARAAEMDARRAQGEDLGWLMGIPIALKDNLCLQGIPTTCASRILEGYVPPYNATVVERLWQAGAVVLGKTNLDEFAMGSSTEHSAYQVTANPWDITRVPGGSSGGSGAAVAAQTCVAALGSDTGGSIRLPAAFCGVVGLKPTYGRVSRYGLVAYASSLDQIGPLAPTVMDAALVLQVIAGHDPKDSTSLAVPVPDYAQALTALPTKQPLKGVTLGVIQETVGEGLDPQVRQAFDAAVAQFQSLGAQVVPLSCPTFATGLAAYYIIAPAEASANLARYDGVKYGLRVPAPDVVTMYEQTRGQGFGPEVKRRIMLGTYTLSRGYYDAYYLQAQKVRTLIRRDFEQAFTQVQALLSPTAPVPAFPIGSKRHDPLSMYLTDLMTIPVNLAGLPAVSVPCGFTAEGLPIGLQIIGPVLQETRLLQIAHAYEQSTPWHRRVPPLVRDG
ncbi:MAG: Asp-tRNA(Asn)/Glu-tRNA(Gln) amidotransferase subunit GatA [Gloeomargarita sp. SKYBB_i_bin120]|nr:Asp-tRNA(Asn)/Glu-tRNA(Gln) amidotransferase subunit GatA [Gloeomargarita sp. SKYG98]MCS7291443.1 Asp-tRNA(Asn)/Glu-tRNA(Gln) amidotransferase subunit GatA [Gloeomargarita sp. SKYB120]MDW8177003.1 Asp-tRNA(Asn)/Glu-tRNA(Gln) amidotransferase subunit GatA [Gloeomargarita sp. SKYBB_i_bin120]